MVNPFEFRKITNLRRRFRKSERQQQDHLEYIRGKEKSMADPLSRVDPLSLEPQDAKCNSGASDYNSLNELFISRINTALLKLL